MISYNVDDNGVLTIWRNKELKDLVDDILYNEILATLEDCGKLDKKELEDLVDDVLYEMDITEEGSEST